MYTLETRESTIRIPAEYIRRGRRLEDHIDELAHDAFECRFDEDENFTLLTFDHEAVGRGKIIHGDGAIYSKMERRSGRRRLFQASSATRAGPAAETAETGRP